MGEEKPVVQVDRKARLKIPAQVMPKQDPAERIHNWRETYLPLDLATAKIEAERCIQCPAAPCIKACPVHNDIPGAFWKLEQGDIIGAAEVFYETSNLPDMCGRLCPQESLCEGHCVVGKNAKPVAIGRLEVFINDYAREDGAAGYRLPDPLPAPSGCRAAVVGAGPAGLAVAEELARQGHAVTVFDAWPEPGGILLYGIPNFKMEKHILDAKLDFLRRLGVQFVGGVTIGREKTVEELFSEGFHAVFLGHGASAGGRLGIPGEELPGVILATEFLVRGNLKPEQLPEEMRRPIPVGHKLVVLGGGDTAMDCVRTAVRLGFQEVTCVYRRTESEQKGRAEERVHAREEGVRFEYLTAPLRFIPGPNGGLGAVECQRMTLGEPDESGRRRPVPLAGSEFIVEADTAVVAIGYHVDREVARSAQGVYEDADGRIIIDRETGETSRAGVFAGGDCVNGADLVVTALADGRRAAEGIHGYLCSLAGVESAAPVS